MQVTNDFFQKKNEYGTLPQVKKGNYSTKKTDLGRSVFVCKKT